ncbi:MAG TPA: nitrate- and nitrite sensing domain-containing protein [Actinocrinis sp.]|nr:nitrate- and nitrite sensing domain-containing protein [Actinocrinis sp.]
MALHARTARPQTTSGPGARRQLSLRIVLLVLAFVPSAAMVALLALNAGQYYGDWRTATTRENSVISSNGSIPATGLFYDLQQEREAGAAALADPAADTAKLAQVRKLTDASASALEALSGVTTPSVATALQGFETLLRQLPGYRAAIDDGTASQEQAYTDYTTLISSDLTLFAALTKTGIADIDEISAPAIPQGWAAEMISREDAIITAGAVSGQLTLAQRSQIDQAVGAEQFIYQNDVIPDYPASVGGLYQAMLSGPIWQQKTQVEQALDQTPVSAGGVIAVPTSVGPQWQQVMAALGPQLQQLTQSSTGYVLATANGVIHSLETRLIVQTALGAVGVLLVLGFTWWLIGRLRRRIFALQSAAEELETRLPDVVERLRRGEPVDTDAELPELLYGTDELGMLGRALNAARASALETSVRQVEQYRGFERLLQRIARRTQLLIGLQMKRLSEMERQHEDPALLEGLFDLDHLTARLRRYEENLVILGGGQTQRRWRKPVPLLNVLRSAQGEVQDYRRIRIETDSRVWISERAVGALVHVLAELMENAVAFSKPPAPVEVTAATVARGLAVEIEDRGMGLEAEQYAEANALMADPPRMDVLSRADDARLGLYVVARLAANLGVKVELRPSSYGGTRVVVLIPADLVLAEDQVPSSAQGGEEFDPAPRPAAAAGTASGLIGAPRTSTENADRPDRADRLPAEAAVRPQDPADPPAPEPLPRRVRQVSMVAELRETPGTTTQESDADPYASIPPGRSGATIGAFQRQSRLARLAADPDPAPGGEHETRAAAPDPDDEPEPPLARPAPDAEQTREEDGR